MKRMLLAALCCIPFGAPASAQQWVSWYGDAIIEDPTAGCSSTGGTQAGSFVGMTYNPANIGANGTTSSLAVFQSRSGMSMRIVDGSFAGGNQPYEGRGVSGNGNRFQYPTAGNTTQGLVETFSQVPTTLTDQTLYVQLTTRVTGYFGNANCTLTLRSYLVRRAGPEGGPVTED